MAKETPFRGAADVFDWLSRFVNLEQGVMPPSMRPERMRIIADAAGNPEKAAPAIHVAGSKGKGSVTAMAAAILEEAGYRVGRYMSPHVVDYRERITLGDRYFDEAVYVEAGERLRRVEAALSDREGGPYRALRAVSDGGAAEPTFFELLTLYFFLCARSAGCDALAVETGMGGRLDPTNVCRSVCAVITGIELEHTDMLGGTVRLIAGEKAGIIKPETPALVARQPHAGGADALDVFRAAAARADAPLFYLPDIARVENARVSADGTAWTTVPRDGAPLELRVPVPGAIQAENATLALCAARLAFPGISAGAIRRGLARTRLPARFETLRRSPAVVVDGAHTAESIRLCAETWTALYGHGGGLIFGCASGKDAESMARALAPHFSRVTVTKPGSYKPSEPELAFAAWQKAADALPPRSRPALELIPDTAEAVRKALDAARAANVPLLGTGSFYMAAEIRRLAF